MDAFYHAAEGYIATCATPMSDMFALKSIALLTRWLPVAVRDGDNKEARTQVALANTLSGLVESTSSCTSEHGMEHALSASHPELAHGAGLVMLSKAYFRFFLERISGRLFEDMAAAMGEDLSALPEDRRPGAFLTALEKLISACGLDGLRMSDFGITKAEIPDLARNARHTMGGLFDLDRYGLSFEETVEIFEKSHQ